MGDIETHYKLSDHRVYAHYAAIVQSSGMGKSRTVDEHQGSLRHTIKSSGSNVYWCVSSPLRVLDHILILISGYPPADHSARDYLTTAGSKDVAYDRASTFLEALFKHTTDTLRDFDSSLDYVGLAFKCIAMPD